MKVIRTEQVADEELMNGNRKESPRMPVMPQQMKQVFLLLTFITK